MAQGRNTTNKHPLSMAQGRNTTNKHPSSMAQGRNTTSKHLPSMAHVITQPISTYLLWPNADLPSPKIFCQYFI